MNAESNGTFLSDDKGYINVLPSNVGSGVITGIGVFTILIAVGFNAIRKTFYKDEDNLDLAFDAGGKVSVGLTATTIVSQWTWAATLLQSAAVATKYGISGPFWYASGATIQIILFSLLSVKLKIRAPGAKTFLQVVRCRFGYKTHKIYCFYALMTNVVVTAMLMLGGAEILKTLIDGFSVELATILCAFIIMGYTIIGGLGATFYASYFNTTIIFLGILIYVYSIYFSNSASTDAIGSIEKVYNQVEKLIGPEGNKCRSYLTILSSKGLIFGIINVIGNFGTVFIDQSYWQSSIAAKPKDGVFGFLIGGIVWFAVPFTFATTMGLGYLALSAAEGQPILSDSQVNAGLVPAAVVSNLGGYALLIILLLMILMAVTSTGSAEVMAVASILVYDIYMVYLKPFRNSVDMNSCILCGMAQGRKARGKDSCKCESIATCTICKTDDMARKAVKRALKPQFTCRTHGEYRRYQELLADKKTWSVFISSLAILPLTLLLQQTGITLGYVYLFMGVLIGSAVIPIGLSLFWDGLTPNGMSAGPTFGTLFALFAWLGTASTYENGLDDFIKNTSEEISMLVGNVVSLVSGGIVTVVLSICENGRQGLIRSDKEEVWATTLDIDNPLYPWTELYKKELNLKEAHKLHNRPSLEEIERKLSSPQRIAFLSSIFLTIFLLFLWPALVSLVGVFSFSQFYAWVIFSALLGLITGIIIMVVPIYGEVQAIRDAMRDKRRISVAPSDFEIEEV